MIDAIGGLLAVETIPNFGERPCCILMRGLSIVTPKALFTFEEMMITSQQVLVQKPMSVKGLVDTPFCVLHLVYHTITAEEESRDVAELTIAEQASSLYYNDTEKKSDDTPEKNA